MMPYLMTSARPARNSRSGKVRKRVEIAQHQPRLIKRADEIFAGLQIDADLAADGAVHLRQQRRRHLHKRDAAQIRCRDKPRQIADHAAAERDDEGFAFEPVRREQVVAGLNGFQTFGRFARRNHNQRRRKACRGEGIESRFGKPSADVGVGDDGATRAEFQARTFAAELVNQTRRNFDRVTAISQLYGNGAHGPRIKAERAVSKFCRSFSSLWNGFAIASVYDSCCSFLCGRLKPQTTILLLATR